MRTIAVEFVDAFIDGGVGGNIAGIVLEGAAELSTAERQDLARRAAVSETAFVLPSDTADYSSTRRRAPLLTAGMPRWQLSHALRRPGACREPTS